MSEVPDVRARVRERYASIAEGASCGCGCGCESETASTRAASRTASTSGCCTRAGEEDALLRLGYTPEQAAAIPEGADLGLGCGNPIAHADVKTGETVLDLGCGAGIDVFLAAQKVGPQGRAIGVDMTAAMIERARAGARRGGATNVEFRLGEIEHLPVADASVDAVISNCVINLSPEKAQVFREAKRVLRPGGRLVVSDLVWERAVPDDVRARVDALCGCVAGASLKPDYLRLIEEAGFRDVEVVEEGRYAEPALAPAEEESIHDAMSAVVSIKVRAFAPAAQGRSTSTS